MLFTRCEASIEPGGRCSVPGGEGPRASANSKNFAEKFYAEEIAK